MDLEKPQPSSGSLLDETEAPEYQGAASSGVTSYLN